MHIAEGILTGPVSISTSLVSLGLAKWSLAKTSEEEIPKISLITASFFISSLIHIPIGPTSLHLILNSLTGIILGPSAFISILIGLFFQALMFSHGGITSLGANSLIMGIPALLCGFIFKKGKNLIFKTCSCSSPCNYNCYLLGILGSFLSFVAISCSALILYFFLIFSSQSFQVMGFALAFSHFPVMIVESLVNYLVILVICKNEPKLLMK